MRVDYKFSFTAMPRIVVTDKPNPSSIKVAKEKKMFTFIIMDKVPDIKQVDTFITGYLAGCGIERDESVAIFFNDLGISNELAITQFNDKYRSMKYPDRIEGYSTLAVNRSPNLLSSFIGKLIQPIDDLEAK